MAFCQIYSVRVLTSLTDHLRDLAYRDLLRVLDLPHLRESKRSMFHIDFHQSRRKRCCSFQYSCFGWASGRGRARHREFYQAEPASLSSYQIYMQVVFLDFNLTLPLNFIFVIF